MLPEIAQTDYVRQRQDSIEEAKKNWPSYSSRSLEYAECG